MKWKTLCIAGLGMLGGAAQAQEPAADKSRYTLFNPTPPALMRPMNTDRPDVTESPYTVDAGHFQVELSFLEYTDDRTADEQGFSVLPTNFKVGLLNDLDLQLLLNPYQTVRHHDASQNSGFGDTQLRTKLNLWGNDGGPTAFGIMPFITLPTGTDGLSNHHVEGGIILALSANLPAGFTLGTMAEFELNRNQANDGYGVDVLHTATLSHPLFVKHLDMYVEYAGISPIATGQTYQAFLDTGLTYAVTPNLQLDAGINIGLSDSAQGYTLFSGLSFRL